MITWRSVCWFGRAASLWYGAKAMHPATGSTLLSTSVSIAEDFLPFKALDQTPGTVRDASGGLVSVIRSDGDKYISGTRFIGVMTGYSIRQMWFAVEYSDMGWSSIPRLSSLLSISLHLLPSLPCF